MNLTLRRMAATFAAAVLLCTPTLAAHAGEPQSTEVRFSNSCSAEVQTAFAQGIAMLHSFEYPETARIFGEILERDPGCAMAHWGMAMSVWHPFWAPPSAAELQRGAALLARSDGLEMTARERAYIDALGTFFSSTDTTTHVERLGAFAAAMGNLYDAHLDDPEAAVFYALALRAAADPRDKSYAKQYQATALLNWVGASQPTHPGVLHYIIHCYDYPGLAHLALDAAETYAAAAPDSAHAQHMPSHIFTRLGLWDQSLASNHDSTRSAAEYTVRANLSGHYDEGLHSIDYLMYALLQTARDDEARELLVRLESIGDPDVESFKVAYTYAAAPARYALERRAWEEAAETKLVGGDFDWDGFGWALSIHHFARGIGAARSGQIDAARRELAAVEELQRGMPTTTLPYWREEVQVHVDAVNSWIAFAQGDEENALRLAAAAADREDAVDKHPVTPGEVLPARELYADMLLDAGRPGAALQQYEIVLTGSPNRLNALLGAANAAAAAGDTEYAERLREIATEQAPGRSDNLRRSP